MMTFIVGFVMGLLSFPLIYYLSPRIIVEISQRKMLKINSKSKGIELTDEQAKILAKSMHKCTDVYWINAIVQRFYLELSRSYATELRVRATILRKFESLKVSGYIKNIEITSIVLGKEAPYIESVQVLSREDVQRMISYGDYDISKAMDEEEKLIKLENEIREGLEMEHEIFRRETGGIVDDDPSETFQESKDGARPSFELKREPRQPYKEGERESNLNSPMDISKSSGGALGNGNEAGRGEPLDKTMLSKEAFEKLQILFGVEYKGGIRISLSFELPKKITVKVAVFINGFKGDVLVRLPSKDYDTRSEYCFLSNPNLIITVESGISNVMGRLYFRKSISNFLERYIKQLLLKTMVYPSWTTQYLPFVIPPTRNITHRIEKVTLENHSIQVPQITKDILLYSSMDYRIMGSEDGVVYRRINYFINGEGRILCAHFSIPKTSLKTSHFTSKNLFFRGLTVQESKIMNQLYNWSIFSGVISSFCELRVKSNLCSDSSLVRFIFEGSQYEFIRLVAGNSLIFQRNDPENPEFLMFRIVEEVLYIYQYITTEQLLINKRRIAKLRKKFDFKPLTALGSASLYRLIRFSKKAAFNYFKKMPPSPTEENNDPEPAEEKNEIVKTELVEIFEDIKKSIDGEDYISKKMCSKACPETVYKVLAQDEVRIKLFSEECDIYTVIDETDNIRSIVVENRSSFFENSTRAGYSHPVPITRDEDSYQDTTMRMEGDFVIHSYFDTGLIIDLRIQEGREVFIYKILSMEENSCGYESKILLFYSKAANIRFPNYFVEAFQLRIRQDEYLTIAEGFPYETSPVEKEFRKEVQVTRGAIYIEFYTEISDDYSFILHSAKNGEVVYDIYKIITSRRARIIFPVLDERDVLTVILTPKFNRNGHIYHKLLSLPQQFHTETLVDCNIGLSKNMKFYCPILGNTDSVIFWEKADDDEIKGYIEDNETRVIISKNGSMRTDNKEYHICYKNKGEKKREIKIFVGLCLRKV